MWDLRILVLLSFILQVILSIFGGRRKYISSRWINSVLVWSAYIMADWVATVALGKLSDAQDNHEKNNVLWAIWAPLLLLHLGGPDSITAYSLEDNQLWMRHLMGLAVQLFVAIYVILMSWKNSWFSFMTIPALIAGIIKYGERTWVLKSVSEDKYLHRIPLGDLRDKYPTDGHDYVRVLVVAHNHLRNFLNYLESEGCDLGVAYDLWVNMETNILWDALEVQMGLVFDLLYTKATVIYSKGAFIRRCISFGCTVTVLLGLIFQIVLLKTREDDEENWHEIDIAVTWVLAVGALALEIYAAIVIFSSNWGMLWLISQGKKEWVTWLSQRFPWLFNKKKNWSQMMGQFDLLGYYIKLKEPDVQSSSRKIIRSLLGKWNRYQHKTAYPCITLARKHKTACFVHPRVYNTILELSDRHYDSRISDSLTCELNEIWKIVGYPGKDAFLGLVKRVHLATEICYRLEMEWDAGGEDDPSRINSSSWKQNREVSKALSDYMMYIVIMHPSLLPNIGPLRVLEWDLRTPERLIGDARDINTACRNLLGREREELIELIDGSIRPISRIVRHLKGNEKAKRWEIIKLMWLRTLHTATRGDTGFDQINRHFQQLRRGGEFLTLIWLINPPHVGV
ncbi:hypothetical protein RHSIM_Rhsim01G0021400 [Rhododendron simsii]|uniref:DUF4220 domain-containing protein n=1 Tax=Rhododendron simsii TaxID=118357 RepID=A0A834HHI8_RHOSS|nr:hypothetical protein RHSIM_Rhsim01G0021400 [Rhododendron simsii]